MDQLSSLGEIKNISGSLWIAAYWTKNNVIFTSQSFRQTPLMKLATQFRAVQNYH